MKRDEEVKGLVARNSRATRPRSRTHRAGRQADPHGLRRFGGQHPYFASISTYASRPDALARGPVDVALDDSAITQGAVRKGRMSPVVQVAAAKINRAKVAALAPATAAANARDSPIRRM